MEDLPKEYFLQILKKYRLGTASRQERELLISYYKAIDSKPDILNQLSSFELDKQEQEILQGIYQKIAIEEQLSSRKANSIHWMWQTAAATVILMLGLFVYMARHNGDKPRDNPVTNKVPTKTNNLIQLADGTTVLLSPGSVIDYPDSFEGRKKREVYLTGEAYFDVQHNPKKPFIVHTGKLTTTVLGTAFNIKALPNEQSITITVTRGKVQIGNNVKTLGILLPDQQVIYDISHDEIKQEKVNAEEIVEWKQEDLLFDDVTVASAARLIEERFNLKFVITDENLKNKRFSTSFGKNEPLESVLNSIVLFNDASYKIDSINKQVILSPQ